MDIDSFVEQHGRRPRLLVAKWDKTDTIVDPVVASAFADVVDVDLSPMFATPKGWQGRQEHVHIVGASSLALATRHWFPS